MDEVIKTITEWPVIVQGALGSALFTFLFYIGQKSFTLINNFLSNFSKSIKKVSLLRLHRKYTGLKAHKENDLVKSNSVQIGLIYRAMRKIISGIIWIIFGLILNPFIYGFELIGYLGGLYFMFSALSSVQAINTNVNVNQKLKEIEEELQILNA